MNFAQDSLLTSFFHLPYTFEVNEHNFRYKQ